MLCIIFGLEKNIQLSIINESKERESNSSIRLMEKFTSYMIYRHNLNKFNWKNIKLDDLKKKIQTYETCFNQ